MGLLDGKVALVTGGASGIGEAAVRHFAAEGASVMAADVNDQAGAKVSAEIKAKGQKAEFVRCDISRGAEVKAAVAKAVGLFGGLDVLFANAGIQFGKTVTETSEEEWDKLMSVNLRGTFLCCQAVIPEMIKRKGGSIVITASVNGMVAEPKLAAYCASKGGLIMLAKSIALDYGPQGIRANALCPGWVDTPINEEYLGTPENRKFGDSLHPRNKIGTPAEIARAAAFLASDQASFVTGAAFLADGGITAVLNGHRFA